MIKVLFVCHGSICRSPMAMYAMRDMVQKRGCQALFQIDCAATSREEIGNPVYPPARRRLAREGINCDGYHARKMVQEDYDRYDYIIGMDEENLHDMYAICEGNDPYDGYWRRRGVSVKEPNRKIVHVYDPRGRQGEVISLLMDYTNRPGEVADPWYTGNFEETWQDVTEGIEGFWVYLARTGQI